MDILLLPVDDDPIPEWHDDAQCRGTDHNIFFPHTGGRPTAGQQEMVNIAKSICAPCPVRSLCLDYALRTKQKQGIWGGLTPGERDRVRKRGRKPAA